MKHYKKKLVYILHDIAVGGVEVALLSALPVLSDKYDLKIIVLGSINPSLIAHFTSEQKKVFHVFSYPIYQYPLYLNKIVNHVIRLEPDYLICSLWRSLFVGSIVKARYKDVKFFTFIHSVNFFHFADKIFTSFGIKKADVVLTDSGSSLEFVKNNFQLTCPLKVVSFLTNLTPEYKERRGIKSADPIKIMFLGRLDKVKNLPLLIEVIIHLRKRGHNVTLDIYGRWDNAYSATVEAIHKNGLDEFVQLKGEVLPSAKFEIFNRYDLYLQLSAFEGMAMSVAEAMQNGIPCILSPVGEIPNYAKDMESAIFIDIWDPNKWEDSLNKIEQVLKNEQLYFNISKKCWLNFKNRKIFVDSLIDSIEAY